MRVAHDDWVSEITEFEAEDDVDGDPAAFEIVAARD